MQSDYLPKYFQDNNAGKHQDTDPMTSDYRSFYAFRIGDHYIDCMDLADQIEIADTEPETQAEAVAQEVETPESQTIASDTSEEKDTSSMLINSETEISADLDGDGKEDIVRVVDNGDIVDLAKDGTRLIANVNGVDTAIKDYEGYVYGSRITTGDLSGDGKADVLLERYIFGSNYGAVEIYILHLEDSGWVEYPYNFIHNPNIDLEQPDTFDDEVYLGVTLFEKDGKVMVRFISFQDNDKSQNTVKCTEASYCEDGWYIEDIKMIPDFFSGDKYERLLAPLYETENVNEEEMIEQNSEKADDKIQEFSMDEIEELFFGEWEVTKLLGFTKIQNDYTNYPEGHDIIGNHIVINEDVFSSEGLEKYERYQCEVLEPSYEVSPIIDRNWIYNISEAVKEDPELYDWILNYDEFQDLEIRGTRDGIKGKSPAVNIMISSDKQFVILTMDCVFYLLEKI